MNIERHTRKRVAKTGLAMILLGAMLGMTGFVSAPAGAKADGISVTLCHRTNSVTNPYRVITVSVDGSNGEFQGPDHTGHDGPAFDFSADPAVTYPPPHNGDQWGDIIPPYSWTGGSYPGLNWPTELTTADEIAAFLATGCGGSTGNPPTPAGRLTLQKVTAGPAQPTGISTTPFDFSVTCVTDGGSVPDATPSLTPADGTDDVATGLDTGDSCTVSETSASSAFTTTYSVGGGSSQAGPVNVSFTDPEQVISVVVTNTYACPTGTSNGAGGCTIVTDACPSVDGIQASVAECPIVVEDNTLTRKLPVEVEGTQLVAGPVAAAELPRTGNSTLPLTQLGLGLVLMGAGALIFGREQTATA